MRMFVILLLTCIFGAITAAPSRDKCPAIMHEAGLSPMFAPMVTHSIHSLSLEDIRYYFKSNATEDNGIPTVNMDLGSAQRVLPNAPLAGYDEDFSTMGMKSFDLVMRNMNRTWWGVSGYNVLEKVAHALHMSEAWSDAREQYKRIEKLVDPDSDTCTCVRDIENNGVLSHLHLIAFKIRYPGITSGNDTIKKFYLDQRNLKTLASHQRKRDIISDKVSIERRQVELKESVEHRDKDTGIAVGAGGGVQMNRDGVGLDGEVYTELGGVKLSLTGGAEVERTSTGIKAKVSPIKFKVDGILDTDLNLGVSVGSDGVRGSADGKVGILGHTVGAGIGGGVGVDDDGVSVEVRVKVDIFDGYNYDAGYNAKAWSWGDDDDDCDSDQCLEVAPWNCCHVAYCRSHQLQNIDFNLADLELLEDVAEKLADGNVSTIDHLDSTEQWKYWKDMLKMPKQDTAHHDLAVFMYCMLN